MQHSDKVNEAVKSLIAGNGRVDSWVQYVMQNDYLDINVNGDDFRKHGTSIQGGAVVERDQSDKEKSTKPLWMCARVVGVARGGANQKVERLTMEVNAIDILNERPELVSLETFATISNKRTRNEVRSYTRKAGLSEEMLNIEIHINEKAADNIQMMGQGTPRIGWDWSTMKKGSKVEVPVQVHERVVVRANGKQMKVMADGLTEYCTVVEGTVHRREGWVDGSDVVEVHLPREIPKESKERDSSRMNGNVAQIKRFPNEIFQFFDIAAFSSAELDAAAAAKASSAVKGTTEAPTSGKGPDETKRKKKDEKKGGTAAVNAGVEKKSWKDLHTLISSHKMDLRSDKELTSTTVRGKGAIDAAVIPVYLPSSSDATAVVVPSAINSQLCIVVAKAFTDVIETMLGDKKGFQCKEEDVAIMQKLIRDTGGTTIEAVKKEATAETTTPATAATTAVETAGGAEAAVGTASTKKEKGTGGFFNKIFKKQPSSGDGKLGSAAGATTGSDATTASDKAGADGDGESDKSAENAADKADITVVPAAPAAAGAPSLLLRQHSLFLPSSRPFTQQKFSLVDAGFLLSALRGGFSMHFGKQLLAYVTYASTNIAMINKLNMYLGTGTIFTDATAINFHMYGDEKKALVDIVQKMGLFDFEMHLGDGTAVTEDAANSRCRRGHPLDAVDTLEGLKLVVKSWGLDADDDGNVARCDECNKTETFQAREGLMSAMQDGKMRTCGVCRYRMCCSCYTSQVSTSEVTVKANAVEASKRFGQNVMGLDLLTKKVREQIVDQIVLDSKNFCTKWKQGTDEGREPTLTYETFLQLIFICGKDRSVAFGLMVLHLSTLNQRAKVAMNEIIAKNLDAIKWVEESAAKAQKAATATALSSTGFGSTMTPAASATTFGGFGSPASSSGGFGSPAASPPPPSASGGFGSPPASPAPASAPIGGFGSPSPTPGAPASSFTNPFAAMSASSSPVTMPLGAPAPAASSLSPGFSFGGSGRGSPAPAPAGPAAAATTTAFGAPVTATPFGATNATTTPFGATDVTTTPFGATNATRTIAASSNTTTTPFGATNATTTPFGATAATTAPFDFGAPPAAAVPVTTTPAPAPAPARRDGRRIIRVKRGAGGKAKHKIPAKEEKKTERQLLEGFIESNVSMSLYEVEEDGDDGSRAVMKDGEDPPVVVRAAMVGLMKMKDVTKECMEAIRSKLVASEIPSLPVQEITFENAQVYNQWKPDFCAKYPAFMKSTNIGLCPVPSFAAKDTAVDDGNDQMAVYVRVQKVPFQLQGAAMHGLWEREPALLVDQNVTIAKGYVQSHKEAQRAFKGHGDIDGEPFRVGKYYPAMKRFAVTNVDNTTPQSQAVLFNPDDYLVSLDFTEQTVPLYSMSYLCAPETYIRDCQVCYERFTGDALGLNTAPFRNYNDSGKPTEKYKHNPALFCFQHYHITGDGRDIRNPRHPGTLCASCLRRHTETMLKEVCWKLHDIPSSTSSFLPDTAFNFNIIPSRYCLQLQRHSFHFIRAISFHSFNIIPCHSISFHDLQYHSWNFNIIPGTSISFHDLQ
jgi:hypothetical protein